MKILIAVIVLLAVSYYCLGRVFADFALKRGSSADSAVKETLKHTAEKTPAEILEAEKREEGFSWGEKALSEEIEIKSEDDLMLHGFLYKNETDTHRYVILMHGFQDDHHFMEPYGLRYYENGYHVLIPDQRGHGMSDGKYTTMGWRERDDIRRWVDRIPETDPEAEIVLHGVSMGSSSIMLAAGDGLPENVRVCIADCGYTSLWTEYMEKTRDLFHVPPALILTAADIAARIRPGFPIRKVNCTEALKKNRIPMLFIHGDADDYNPYWMMEELYNADASSEKEKLTVHGARHARSIYTDYELYWNTVWGFTGKYL